MADAPPRSSSNVLTAALGLALIAEIACLSGAPIANLIASMSRVFVLGAAATLLAHVAPEDRHGLQSRALLASFFSAFAAAVLDVLGALTNAIWSVPPQPVLLIVTMLAALLPLMALTLLTVAVIPLRGIGICLAVASALFMMLGPAAAFATLCGDDVSWLMSLARVGSIAIALLGSFIGHTDPKTSKPSISIPKTSTPSTRAAMALTPEPLWHQALQGVRLLRAAELTRLVVMLLVFLIGLVIIPLGPAWLVSLLIGQDLALVLVAVTALAGFWRFTRIPAASGARGAAFAGLVLATLAVIHTLGAAAVDIAFLFGPSHSELSLDHAARFSTLGTLVAVCVAIHAIARRANQPHLRGCTLWAALCYSAATLALTGADTLDHDAQIVAVVLKLAALLLFATGFARLVRALTDVGPLIEAERRRALSGEFS